MADKNFTTEAEVQGRSAPSIALAVCSIGLCMFAAVAILATRTRFSQMLTEFGLEVSVITRFAIGPILPTFLAVVTLAAVAKEFVPPFRSSRDRCNVVVLLVGASAAAVYVVGIFEPLLSLIEGLS